MNPLGLNYFSGRAGSAEKRWACYGAALISGRQSPVIAPAPLGKVLRITPVFVVSGLNRLGKQVFWSLVPLCVEDCQHTNNSDSKNTSLSKRFLPVSCYPAQADPYRLIHKSGEMRFSNWSRVRWSL